MNEFSYTAKEELERSYQAALEDIQSLQRERNALRALVVDLLKMKDGNQEQWLALERRAKELHIAEKAR
ncbi:MAG: hypothetical protein KGL39_60070 [Patescibacteria group bacterium]|nr:hypothetical protein [Patescibacteria group bacterium]